MKLNYYELEPEENTFYSVVADVTHRCNMKCANCYIPNRTIPDMDKKKFFECISKFPKRAEVRLIGAEPTVREDLDELIWGIRKAGHRPALMTNGLKLVDFDYAKSLKKAGLHTVNISMNGADDDKIYKVMDGQECAQQKTKALDNCAKLNFFINTNTVIMKDLNDRVPFRLYQMMKELKVGNAVLRFRNVAQLGRYTYQYEENHTYEELIEMIGKQFGKQKADILKHNTINGHIEERSVLFPVEEGKKYKTIQIKITDWSPQRGVIPDPNSKRRGRITEDFKVAPFFEHVKMNENFY